MPTWKEWEIGEHKELNQFERLRMYWRHLLIVQRTLLSCALIGNIKSKDVVLGALVNAVMVPRE